MNSRPVPVVSVAMITYQHRPFIAQALESVLAQRRDFPIEIVISDDCSTDGTGEIIDQYQAAHPDLFRRLDPPANVGMFENFNRVWKACAGKYIATLDGDDWWHDPEKLAIQVAFMEEHPECTVSGHSHRRQIVDKSDYSSPSNIISGLADGSVVAGGLSFMTCTAMYRSGIVDGIPNWATNLAMGDWPIMLMHGAKGKVGTFDRCMSTYRIHQGGVWSGNSEVQQFHAALHACKQFPQHFPKSWRKGFYGGQAGFHSCLFQIYRDQGNALASRKHWLLYCYYSILSGKYSILFFIKMPLRFIYPGKKK